ncbi:hypothetical protein KDA_74320 [Dictyobacter alpinus]|uniref:Uncharacterized protein n=1 Tax=Dictyobacter alpinus TaxID=2014873 RepID=A0A402BKQ6_9CHLR|nr:hypothetical protein KDA_74320 [Dictyobacter alpinus]
MLSGRFGANGYGRKAFATFLMDTGISRLSAIVSIKILPLAANGILTKIFLPSIYYIRGKNDFDLYITTKERPSRIA